MQQNSPTSTTGRLLQSTGSCREHARTQKVLKSIQLPEAVENKAKAENLCRLSGFGKTTRLPRRAAPARRPGWTPRRAARGDPAAPGPGGTGGRPLGGSGARHGVLLPSAGCRPLCPTPRPPTGSGSPGGAAGLLWRGSVASGRGMWAEQRGALGLLWLLEGGVTIWGFSWVCVLVQSSRVVFEAVISLFLLWSVWCLQRRTFS